MTGRVITGRVKAAVPWIGVAAVAAILVVESLASLDTSARELVDTDGYMRTVRAAELLSGESGWFAGEASRSNAPFGHSMHWTRPMDGVLITAGIPWLLPGSDGPEAVYWGSIVAGPLLMIAVGMAVAWAGLPLLGRRWAALAGAIAIAQPALVAYTSAGRSDHHALIMLTGALSAGAVIRTLTDGRMVFPVIAGAAMGLGLWVSVESLFVIAVVALVLGVAWAVRAVPARRGLVLWLAAAVATLLGWLAERAVDLGGIDYDRISVVHVVLMVLMACAWWAGTRFGDKVDESVGRLVALLIAGVVAGGMAAILFPGLLAGPFAGVPPDLHERWLSRVVELQPMVERSWPTAVALMVVPLIGLLGAGARVRRESVLRWPWALVAAWIGVGLSLSLAQTRWIMYAQLMAGVPVALAARNGIEWFSDRSRPLRVVGTAATLVVVVFGWRLFVGFPVGSGEESGEGPSCAVAMVADDVEPADAVLAAIDWGPEILWRTEASVVASPYHRNVDGILDTLDAFEGDEAVAKSIVDARGIDTVLVCPGVDGKDYAAGPDSLFTRLVDGNPPAWLDEVPGKPGGFLVYRVTG